MADRGKRRERRYLYDQPLRVERIAAVASAHPRPAMALFRRTFGVSLVHYLTQQRIVHARHLLATTDLNVLDIALSCGFGSSSQFYVVFRRMCGRFPGAFRAALRDRPGGG